MRDTEPTGTWVDAGAIDALPIGRPTLLRHADRRLAVIRADDGEIYAVDDRCPHEGYPLTQGTVAGAELTCCWHNFKFDLRTGGCPRGEAVETFETRRRGDRVEVRVVEPDPAVERAKAAASLEAGLYERRDGQVARDVVRLLQAGASPAEVALLAARFDAERAPFGCTHALPVALDVQPLCDRYPGPDAVRPLMQLMELVAESNVRRDVLPAAAPIDPGPDLAAAEARWRAAVEGERIDEAEGLVRGALAAGAGRDVLEPWLIGVCCDHFLDFGHALIYATKVFDLLDGAGRADTEAVLVGLTRMIVNATREEALPAWAWWRAALDGHAPRFEGWLRADGPAALDEGLVAALLDGKREAAFEAVAAALDGGAGTEAVVDALVAAAAERVRRFDVRHDADDTVQDGWLDVTHVFTFAHAVRSAIARHRRPEGMALLFQAARFVNNARALDRAEHAPVAAGTDARLDAIGAAIAAHDPDRAEAGVRALLRDGGDVEALRTLIEDLPLRDAFVRPIVVAHAIKTTAAAFTEHARRPSDPRPLAALARFVASPVRQRFIGERAHEAVRFIVHGKVPRLLT